MTKENAKQFLPLVQALADGKTVQTKNGCLWQTLSNFEFCKDPSEYRIKPEPNLIPWEGGIEVGQKSIIVRQLNAGEWSWCWQVLAIQHDGFVITDCKGTHTISWQELFSRFEHSIDGGSTWKPCGMIE